MANSVDPDEMACYELSHVDLHCLQSVLACRDERVNPSTFGNLTIMIYLLFIQRMGEDKKPFLMSIVCTKKYVP